MSKYLTSSGWARCILFSWTGGHEDLSRVKVRWEDFDSLAFIRHFLSHCCMSSRAVCSLCVAITVSAWAARTAVSSAKVAVAVSAVAENPLYGTVFLNCVCCHSEVTDYGRTY